MTTDGTPTRLTLFAHPQAMSALDLIAAELGVGRTDAVNRALEVYAALLSVEKRQLIVLDRPDGSLFTVEVRP
jgi:hypothetical protein